MDLTSGVVKPPLAEDMTISFCCDSMPDSVHSKAKSAFFLLSWIYRIRHCAMRAVARKADAHQILLSWLPNAVRRAFSRVLMASRPMALLAVAAVSDQEVMLNHHGPTGCSSADTDSSRGF